MKKMKKFVALLIVFALMLTNCGLVFAEEAETAEVQQKIAEMSDDCAYFDFDTIPKSDICLTDPGFLAI